MIVKHFYRYKQELKNDQDNVNYVFSTPNIDACIEEGDILITLSIEILDDKGIKNADLDVGGI